MAGAGLAWAQQSRKTAPVETNVASLSAPQNGLDGEPAQQPEANPPTPEPETTNKSVAGQSSNQDAKPASKPAEAPKVTTTQPATTTAKNTSSVPKSAPSTVSAPQPAPQPAPRPTPQPTPTPAPSSNTMLELVNSVRQAQGLSSVKYNSTLNAAALARAKDMAARNYFSHVSPDGVSDLTLASQMGYRYRAIGSNIAKGNFSGDRAVFDAWMSSSGHRANILASYGREIGYAAYNGYFVFFIAEPR